MNVWRVIRQVASGQTGASIMGEHAISRATLYRIVADAQNMGAILVRRRGHDAWLCPNLDRISARLDQLARFEDERNLEGPRL